MTKVLATFCFIFLSISIALAQNEEYSVYFYSGEVFIKQNGKEKAIGRNDVIDKNTSFYLKKNSSLVLVNKNFVPLAIVEVGEFDYKQISEKYKNMKASNINEEYFSYLMSAMLETDNKQHNSGGVFRKPNNSNFNFNSNSSSKPDSDIFAPKLNPPSDIVIIEDEVLFSWQNVFGDNFYVKIVENIDDLKPVVISATGNNVSINFHQLQLDKGKKYIWFVEDNDGPINIFNSSNSFTLASEDLRFKIYIESEEIKKNSPNEEIMKLGLIRLYMDYNIFPFPKF